MPVPAGARSGPVHLPGVGHATARWIEADGAIWPLTDPAGGWFTLADGVSGLDAAPVEFTTDDQPRGGARVRHIQPQPRTVVWPLHVYSDHSHVEFIGRWRSLAGAFTRTRRLGPGVLEVARPDGTRRRINAYYQSGFDGQAARGSYITSDAAVVSLFCEDPFWYDPAPVTFLREYEATSLDFLDPFPSVSSSQTLGATVLTNPTDVEAWPTWAITGPASSITATNNTTGESFSFDPDASAIGHGDLLAGEQMFITTDPPTVRYQDGSNWVGGLDWPGAVLWGLVPGDNDVTFTLSGAGAGSAVELSFHPRFETA